jgi:NAD(P)-dependent dehydrogenase (short-subunit alcohol dehydrogenase family)
VNVFSRTTLQGKTAVVTGGTGSLGAAIAVGLAKAGAEVIVAGRSGARMTPVLDAVKAEGAKAALYEIDALDPVSIRRCADAIVENHGGMHILVNCIGGNSETATTSEDRSFFDLAPQELSGVLDLNWMRGAVLPCQIFGEVMVRNVAGGAIVNISSMAASRPLTRVVAYSSAKAAVENFTRWLAVHLATQYSPKLRVNAVAPGFFLSEQNRYLLTTTDGALTERGQAIIAHTPMARFGEADEVADAVTWLASDAARFVTGIVLPVDGGFSAYAGV